MNKINIMLVFVASFSIAFSAGLKKPAASFDSIERSAIVKNVNDNGQSLSVLMSCLSTNGDLSSDYHSGMSVDFRVSSVCKLPLIGMDLGFGFGFVTTENESDAPELSMGLMALHFTPNLNLPVDFNLNTGLSDAPGGMGVGMMGFFGMDLFYKLPVCDGISLGFQYKQFVDPEDGELNFSKLGTMGIGLKIDG